MSRVCKGFVLALIMVFAISSLAFAQAAAPAAPKADKPAAVKADKPAPAKAAPAKPAPKKGSAMVMKVQEALKADGTAMECDGMMGPKTRAALKAYQQKKNLKVTGKIDKETLKAMGITVEKKPAPKKVAPKKPAPKAAPKPAPKQG